MSVLYCGVSCFFHTLCCNLSRVEISVVVNTHSAVSDNDEEEAAEEEEDAETPSKEGSSGTNEECGGYEDVEIASAGCGLEEKEVVLHELEVAE